MFLNVLHVHYEGVGWGFGEGGGGLYSLKNPPLDEVSGAPTLNAGVCERLLLACFWAKYRLFFFVDFVTRPLCSLFVLHGLFLLRS
jgi:hypothetical protein